MDDKELAREGKGRDRRPAKDVASSGGRTFFDIAVDPDLIRGGYSIQWYVRFFVCACVYICIVVANRWFSIHTYTI